MVIINNGNNYNDGARIDDDDDDGMEAWSYLFTKELLIHKYEPNQLHCRENGIQFLHERTFISFINKRRHAFLGT